MEESCARETLESCLMRSTRAYLEGQNDWKWIVTMINQSGFNKRQTRQLVMSLRHHGWKFRGEALFAWLEADR